MEKDPDKPATGMTERQRQFVAELVKKGQLAVIESCAVVCDELAKVITETSAPIEGDVALQQASRTLRKMAKLYEAAT